ncbi:MAG TPA: metal ABC transporter ATP-binding protein [Thermoanaerobaculia bacterium]|nr:metal ABC transporter ATP-binding protein [Thermoanaerobaculia bacterium]
MQALVELRGVEFAFGRFGRALSNVNLRVEAGEFVAIAGPNGGGKTTLLRIILGLLRPDKGQALLFGEPAHRVLAQGRVAYLPQRARVGMAAPITVRELVASGRASRERWLGPTSRHGRELVHQSVVEVGLRDVIDRPVAQLSGGMQQRAFLARMLAAEPELLALDEPTTGVDADSQERLADLLAGLQQRHRVTILYISHEFGAVERHVHRLVLVRGGIAFDGPISQLPQLWHDPSHAHGRELLG